MHAERRLFGGIRSPRRVKLGNRRIMWDVRRCALSSLEERFATGDAGVEASEFVPERLVVCRQTVERARVEALAARIRSCSGRKVSVVCLPPSGWKGVLRNVPESSDGQEGKSGEVVAVALLPNFARLRAAGSPAGPILVLVGLKYRGNVGTIVRSAVQANFFEAIYIIEDDYKHGDSADDCNGSVETRIAGGSGDVNTDIAGTDNMTPADQLHWAATHEWAKLVGQGWAKAAVIAMGSGTDPPSGSRAQWRVLSEGESARKMTRQPARCTDTDGRERERERDGGRTVNMHVEKPVTDDDITYYSMLNAPLIEIRRFKHSAHFFASIATPHCTVTTTSGCGCVPVRGGVVGIDGGTIVSGSPDSLYSAAAASALESCGYVALGSEDRGNTLSSN